MAATNKMQSKMDELNEQISRITAEILDTLGEALPKYMEREARRVFVESGEYGDQLSDDELVEFIESDDHLRETSLRDLIRRWPSKRLKSVRSLQNAIKGEFFDLFFETMDSLSDDNLRSRAESAFADILKSELSAFLFTPSTISEFEDDWIKPVNKSTEMSGKIKKVLKPGLRDGRGALITPAIVELE